MARSPYPDGIQQRTAKYRGRRDGEQSNGSFEILKLQTTEDNNAWMVGGGEAGSLYQNGLSATAFIVELSGGSGGPAAAAVGGKSRNEESQLAS